MIISMAGNRHILKKWQYLFGSLHEQEPMNNCVGETAITSTKSIIIALQIWHWTASGSVPAYYGRQQNRFIILDNATKPLCLVD